MTELLAARRRSLVTFHPEWWIAPLALAAWLTLALPTLAGTSAPTVHTALYCPLASHPAGWSWVAYTAGVALWCAMTVAMMLPANIAAIRYVAFSSLRRRRNRAIAWFTLAFTLQWLPLGLLLGIWHVSSPHQKLVGATALTAAAVWELTRWKTTAINACRKTLPIRLHGSAARTSCLRYGTHVGRQCVLSCGPAMVALTLAGHPLLLVVLAAPILFLEKRRVRLAQPRTAMIALLVAAAAVTAAG